MQINGHYTEKGEGCQEMTKKERLPFSVILFTQKRAEASEPVQIVRTAQKRASRIEL